jgi:hypothetical protein
MGMGREWEITPLEGPPALLEGSLVGGGTRTIKLAARRTALFGSVEELTRIWKTAPNSVGRPRDLHWPGWDAVTRDVGVFIYRQKYSDVPNETGRGLTLWRFVGASPPPLELTIDVEAITSAAPLVRPGESVRVIFVLLAPQSSEGSLPTPLPSAAARIPPTAPAWARTMVQFLLPIDCLDEGVIARVSADVARDTDGKAVAAAIEAAFAGGDGAGEGEGEGAEPRARGRCRESNMPPL